MVLDLDGIHKWDESCGDTWDPFWADDDNLYAFNCDGRGFGAAGLNRNLALNELQGDSVNTPDGPHGQHDGRVRRRHPDRAGRGDLEGLGPGVH